MNFISGKSSIGENVHLGHFVVIEDDVIIGDNCSIGHNVIIHEGTIIGSNVRIDGNTVIGKLPMRSVNSIFKDEEKLAPAELGNDCLIGAGVIIYCGCRIGEKTLVADTAVLRENVAIGSKTIIGRGTTIENYCKVGSNCKIQTDVYLTAYSEVEDSVFIAPCVVTSNDNYAARSKARFGKFKGVTIKKGGRVGAGVIILPGRVIYEDGFAAAGSVVTKDIEAKTIVKGNPAKFFREVPKDQLLENQ